MQLLDKATQNREQLIDRFEQAWQAGSPPDVESFHADHAPSDNQLLAELLHVDLEWRWAKGEPLDLAHYDVPLARLSESQRAELEGALEELRRGSLPLPPSRRAGGDESLSEGHERLGRFQLRGELGKGTSATVYRAHDPQLGRDVALKVPLAWRGWSRPQRERFEREAQHLASLAHPGIVAVYETGLEEQLPFIVSEYVEGDTLAHYLTSHYLAPHDAAGLILQVADALDHAHRRGIVHRDLKPSNILLMEQERGRPNSPWRARVTDFGLARQVAVDTTLTLDGQAIGTPAYMSPEQATGQVGGVDPRSDLFSLGVVFYELLTGNRPFTGPVEVLLARLVEADPIPPRSIAPGVPRDLETICLKCLEKSPERRYQTASALCEDLRRWERGEPIAARAPSPLERGARYARKHPGRTIAMLASVLGVTLFVLGLQLHNQRLQREARRADQFALRATASAREARYQQYVANTNLAAEAIRNGLGSRAYDLLLPFANDPHYAALWEWRHLWRRCHQELRVCDLPEGTSQTIVSSHDSSRIYVGGAEGKLHTVDVTTGCATDAWKTGLGDITSLALTPEGRDLWIGDSTGQVARWDISQRCLAKRRAAHEEAVTFVVPLSGDRIATGSFDGTVKIWAGDRTEPTAIFRAKHEPYVRAAYDPMREWLLLLTSGGVIETWEVTTGRQLASLGSRGDPPQCLAIHHRTRRLLSGGSDGMIRLYDLDSGAPLREVESQQGRLTQVAFRSDGKAFAAVGDDLALRTWETGDGTPRSTFMGRARSLVALDWLADSPLLVTAEASGALRVWGDNPAAERAEFDGTGRILKLRFAPDSHTLEAMAADGLHRFRDVGSESTSRAKFFTTGDGITSMTYHPGTGCVVTGNSFGALLFWDATSTARLGHLDSLHGRLRDVEYSPDGQSLATIGGDGVVRLWDFSTRQLARTLRVGRERKRDPYRPLEHNLTDVAFSPDGRLVAATSTRGTLHVWQRQSGQLLFGGGDQQTITRCVAFSPDGRLVATGDDSKTVHLRHSHNGRSAQLPLAHAHGVRSITFSHDGSRLACGCDEGSIYLWSVATGNLMAVLSVDHFPITALAFSDDGRWLACGTQRGKIHLLSADDVSPHSTLAREAAALASYCRESSAGAEPALVALAQRQLASPAAIAAVHERLSRGPVPRDLLGTVAEGPWRMHSRSWMIVGWPGQTPEAYAEGLTLAEQAHQALPDDTALQLGYGAALVRAGRYAEAEPLLLRARAGETTEIDRRNVDPLLAICQHHLGKREEALATLRELKRWMQQNPFGYGPMLLAQYIEADRVVRGPDVAAGTPWKLAYYQWHQIDERGLPTNIDSVFAFPPLKIDESPSLSFDWGRTPPTGVPEDHLVMVATSAPELPPGPWELQIYATGEVRALVDGELKIDTRVTPVGLPSTVIESPGGRHEVRIEYFATIGPKAIDASWRPVFPSSK